MKFIIPVAQNNFGCVLSHMHTTSLTSSHLANCHEASQFSGVQNSGNQMGQDLAQMLFKGEA